MITTSCNEVRKNTGSLYSLINMEAHKRNKTIELDDKEKKRRKSIYIKIKNKLKSGVNPDTKDWNRDTPLYTAVENNMSDLALLLIEYGANVNYIASYSKSYYVNNPVLYIAIKRRMYDVASEMIKKGAKVNITHGANNALDLAISKDAPQEIIFLLVDAGAKINYRAGSITNQYTVIHKLVDKYNQSNSNNDLINLALLISISNQNELDLNLKGKLGEDINKLYYYSNILGYKCGLVKDRWKTSDALCRNGLATGKGVAFNKYLGLEYKGEIKNGFLVKGSVFKNNQKLFSGVFNKNFTYMKGTLFKKGVPFFVGYYKKNIPDGPGICFFKLNKEKCIYQKGRRIDPIYIARVEKNQQKQKLVRIRFCQSNPYPLQRINKLEKKLRQPCHSEANNYIDGINEYTPDYTIDHLKSDYKDLSLCIDKLSREHKKLHSLIDAYADRSVAYNCHSNDPIFHNAKMFEEDLDFLDDAVDLAGDIRSEAYSILDDAKRARSRYKSAKRQQEKDQLIGGLLGATGAFVNEYGKIKAQKSNQLQQALIQQARMQNGTSGWKKRQYGNPSNSDESIGNSRYIDKSSSVNLASLNSNNLKNELGASDGKKKIKVTGTTSYSFNCSATGQTTTIQIPKYYREHPTHPNCEAALKNYSKVYSCNLIDNMKSANQRCMDDCDRPDCMLAE